MNKNEILIFPLLLLFIVLTDHHFPQTGRFIIDADTGNEMDDLYAIVRALKCEDLDVIGLTSVHFNNVQLFTDEYWHIYSTENLNTVEVSQELNERILEYLNMTSIPHPMGCDKMIGYSWGYYEGAPIPISPAVDFIIEQANKSSIGDKLNVVCLGAVTNAASAILIDSTISTKIRLYLLSMKMDSEGDWDKNSFNARNDINGLDIILNDEDLEIIVIPGNVSRDLIFNKDESYQNLMKKENPLNKLLMDRWDEVSAGGTWIMWDLALIESLISPEVYTSELLSTPPENTQRMIEVITEIKPEIIKENFWKCLLN